MWLCVQLKTARSVFFKVILPERDYVTFGCLLSQIRLSSVTVLRPTQAVETLGIFFVILYFSYPLTSVQNRLGSARTRWGSSQRSL